MGDIVERLRDASAGWGDAICVNAKVAAEAADEIERLRAQLQETRRIASHELPPFERVEQTCRRIVCEEWHRAMKEFGLTPNSVTEAVVSRIVDRLDSCAFPVSLPQADSNKGDQ